MSGIVPSMRPLGLPTPYGDTSVRGEAPHEAVVDAPAQVHAENSEDIQQVESFVLQRAQVRATMQWDQTLKQIIITLKREDTDDVLRQIPTEEVRRMMVHIMDAMEHNLDVKG